MRDDKRMLSKWIGRGVALWLLAGVPVGALMVVSTVACSKSEPKAPPAPKLPDGWHVLEQGVPTRSDSLFTEVQKRFPAKIKSIRVIAYKVNGHRVVLNIMEAASSHDADLLYRVLAHKKPMFAYWRKGLVLYEFRGPKEAMDDIRAAHDVIAKQ